MVEMTAFCSFFKSWPLELWLKQSVGLLGPQKSVLWQVYRQPPNLDKECRTQKCDLIFLSFVFWPFCSDRNSFINFFHTFCPQQFRHSIYKRTLYNLLNELPKLWKIFVFTGIPIIISLASNSSNLFNSVGLNKYRKPNKLNENLNHPKLEITFGTFSWHTSWSFSRLAPMMTKNHLTRGFGIKKWHLDHRHFEIKNPHY